MLKVGKKIIYNNNVDRCELDEGKLCTVHVGFLWFTTCNIKITLTNRSEKVCYVYAMQCMIAKRSHQEIMNDERKGKKKP